MTQLVSFIFWAFFGYYINKVKKHRYGTKESCCFCLEKHENNTKVSPDQTETMEIDLMQSDTVEAVDAETRSLPGVRIYSLSKSFPPEKKDGKPTVAVKAFSAAL